MNHLASVILAGLLALPLSLQAQLAWETPRMLGPNSPGGLAVHWLQAETLPGDGEAVLVVWQPPALPDGVFLRGGAGTGAGDESAGFGGIDVRAPIASARPGQPLDLAWIAGAGVGVGEYLLFTVPVGLTAGRSWASGSVWFSPYLGVGLAQVALGNGAVVIEINPNETPLTLQADYHLAGPAGRWLPAIARQVEESVLSREQPTLPV